MLTPTMFVSHVMVHYPEYYVMPMVEQIKARPDLMAVPFVQEVVRLFEREFDYENEQLWLEYLLEADTKEVIL